MPVTAPATLTARQELSALTRDLDRRRGLSPEQRFKLRALALGVLAMIDAAEDAPTALPAAQALAAARAFAADAAADLLAIATQRIAERSAVA